jgi:DNA modification methylase
MARPAVLHLDGDTSPSPRSTVRGRLYQGDNLDVMLALLPELEGKIDLLYADPPFNSGRTYRVRVGRGEDSRRPASWRQAPGYADRWPEPGAYLEMLAPRLEVMHRLLAPTGTLYLHLDWRAAAHARVLLDEIFGPDRLLNEIVWVYHGPSPILSAFKRKHDSILVYTKSSRYTFNADAVRIPYDEATWKAFSSSRRAGFGKRPQLARGKVPEDWWYFPVVARLHSERTGYPTQKPMALLERIVRASSRRGDLVADFFCGSGTTAAAAARTGRRWLACDRSPAAIGTTYRRLMMEAPDQRIQLWSAVRRRLSRTGSLRLRWTLSGRDLKVALPAKAVDETGDSEIALWEVDWEANAVFVSRSRGIRSWRSGELPSSLTHRYRRSGTYRVQVRAWDSLGRVRAAVRTVKV